LAREIERKFLLNGSGWRQQISRSIVMKQGYLGALDRCSVRVRIEDDVARLNIKSATLGIEREEFEYAIPLSDAQYMLAHLCGDRCLDKTRHLVSHAGQLWEIDEFSGANAGLIVAEIELETPDQIIHRPDWLGSEVSDDHRYYNVSLVEQPYSRWQPD
jgi:adenylate cyclase